MYPAAPLIRNKRIAIDENTKNSRILQYVDPMLRELDSGKRLNPMSKNDCPQNYLKYPKVRLMNKPQMVDNTVGFIDFQIKSNSIGRSKESNIKSQTDT